jgi:pimeloyl-ACP methyl ester carboxylesterase
VARGFLSSGLERVYPSKARPTTPWAARQAVEGYGRTIEPDWRRIDWGEHLRETWLTGRRVRYVDLGAGEGAPVVFVHGLGGNWQTWLENLPAVARERRVVALDLPGFGESEMPAGRISVRGYARLVEELCRRLDLGPVALVGNSMGGFTVAEMAISYPARVERLVLAAAAGISITHAHRRPTLTAARAGTAAGIFRLTTRNEFVVRPRLRHLALAPVVRHPTRIRADLAHEIMQGSGKPGFVPALDALLAYDFRDRLEEISCPTLLIWGEQDVLVPTTDADEFERRIAGARKVVFPDTGHMPQLELPAAFNRELLSFLREGAEGASEPGLTTARLTERAAPHERAA